MRKQNKHGLGQSDSTLAVPDFGIIYAEQARMPRAGVVVFRFAASILRVIKYKSVGR
jgi:hypothetical protein